MRSRCFCVFRCSPFLVGCRSAWCRTSWLPQSRGRKDCTRRPAVSGGHEGHSGGAQRVISGMGTASARRSCGMVSAHRVLLRPPLACAIVMSATSSPSETTKMSETAKTTTSLSMLCASPQQECGDASPVSSPHVSHLALSRTHSFSSMSHPSCILGPCARRSR